MLTQDQLRDVIGSTAYDSDGDKIGKIGKIYYDDDTDQPTWLTVHTGFFGTNETFVPVRGADVSGEGRVSVSYDKATVTDAPNVSADGHLSVEEEEHLYRYYGLGDTRTDTDTDTGTRTETGTGTAGVVGRHAEGDRDGGRERGLAEERGSGVRGGGYDTSGPNTDEAMTRSEEQLRVGTETREVGRARLRKRVVTEDVSTTVPVSHEEVVVEREPITEANRGEALSGGDITEEEREVVLTEERAVVAKETVAVERVRLGTETVTGQERVDETVRKEVIDTDGVDDVRGDRDLTDRTSTADRDRRGR